MLNPLKLKTLSEEEKKYVYKTLQSVFFNLKKSEFRKIIFQLECIQRLNLIHHELMKAASKAYPNEPIMYFFIQLAYGASIGLEGIHALNNICIIYNRPCVYGDAVKALIQKQKDFRGITCEYLEEQKGYKVTVLRAYYDNNGMERIQNYSSVYTHAAAERAGYLKNKSGNWYIHELRRLELRATWYAAKGAYSDLFFGFSLKEEIEDWKEDENNIEKKLNKEEKEMENILNKECSNLLMLKETEGLPVDNIPIEKLEPLKEEDAVKASDLEVLNSNKFELGVEDDPTT